MGTNIEQVKTLWNVVQEAPDNTVLGKILINIVLILLGQLRTGKNPGIEKRIFKYQTKRPILSNNYWTF